MTMCWRTSRCCGDLHFLRNIFYWLSHTVIDCWLLTPLNWTVGAGLLLFPLGIRNCAIQICKNVGSVVFLKYLFFHQYWWKCIFLRFLGCWKKKKKSWQWLIISDYIHAENHTHTPHGLVLKKLTTIAINRNVESQYLKNRNTYWIGSRVWLLLLLSSGSKCTVQVTAWPWITLQKTKKIYKSSCVLLPSCWAKEKAERVCGISHRSRVQRAAHSTPPGLQNIDKYIYSVPFYWASTLCLRTYCRKK